MHNRDTKTESIIKTIYEQILLTRENQGAY